MDGSPSSVLTFGLGSWGSIGLNVTLGLGVGEDSNAIEGRWSDVVLIHANRDRTAIHADRSRIEVQG
jgi:hypothetical protein